MDEKSDQILNHIESQRSQLGRNLDELEQRVRTTADWRTHFNKNPMLVMSAALGGGVLLGSLVGGRTDSRRSSRSWSGSRYSGTSSSQPGATGSSYLAASSQGSSAGSSSSSSPYLSGSSYSTSSSPQVTHQRHRAWDTVDQVKAALIGFGIAKAKEFLHEALPGFGQHMEEAERKHQGTTNSAPVGGSFSQASQGSSTGRSEYDRYTSQSYGDSPYRSSGSQAGSRQPTSSQQQPDTGSQTHSTGQQSPSGQGRTGSYAPGEPAGTPNVSL